MKGRKPKPSHLRLVRGSKPNPQPPRAPRSRVPAPPAYLSEEARAEWRRSAPELHQSGLLTPRDRPAFAVLCDAYGKWVKATKAAAALEAMTVSKASGNAATHPLLHIARAAAQDFIKFAAEFGMTPCARSRVAGVPPKRSTNPYLDDEPATA